MTGRTENYHPFFSQVWFLIFFVERKIPMSSIAMFEEIPQNELALNIRRIRLIPPPRWVMFFSFNDPIRVLPVVTLNLGCVI